MDEREREIMWRCERWLTQRAPQTAAEVLRAAADALTPDTRPDRYGEGGVVDEFEDWMTTMLGTEAAALFPSGTMAQQIALRIHCERRGSDTVTYHPTCHLEIHEHGAAAHLHGLKAELAGHRDRPLRLPDLEAIQARIGALLIELPQREIGGLLPEWDELVAQVQWARDRGAAVHLDGARIWESAPYYGRSHAEIAGLFDTVYVSLYKGLGGFAGSILAGPAEVIAQARVWRHRHGGTLSHLFPFAAAALRGLDQLLPQMPRFLAHARELATALAVLPGVTIVPDPPQTPLFHVHLAGERDVLWARALDLASEHRVWLCNALEPSVVPGVSRAELNIGEPALAIGAAEAAELFGRLTSDVPPGDPGQRRAGSRPPQADVPVPAGATEL